MDFKKKKKIEIKKFSLQRNLEQTTYVTHLTLSSCYYISYLQNFSMHQKKNQNKRKERSWHPYYPSGHSDSLNILNIFQ